jgi:hypothetical protein
MRRVPGTMKQPLSEALRAADPPDPEIRRWGTEQEVAMLANGAIVAYTYILGDCSVLVGREPVGEDGAFRWHLSIAHRHRYPTWDEIKMARYGIAQVADVPLMAQLLPLIADGVRWTNLHDNCFHLYEVDPAVIQLEIA